MTLVIAGPPAEDGTGQRIGHQPGLLDLGFVDDQTKSDLIAMCDVLCLPSRAEVFPLIFIEAWAMSKPVVSGDFYGAQDVVRDGIDGLIVSVEPAAIAAALGALLPDPSRRAAMGAAGRERVASELNWPAVIGRIERGYQRAMSNAR
jgi:glycosyltransferase involved in cell wall biosynthesis